MVQNHNEKRTGTVLEVNAFGHVMLSWTEDDFNRMQLSYGDLLTFQFLGRTCEIPYCPSYSCVDLGKSLLLPDAANHHIYFSINHGDARILYGFRGGETVSVMLKEKGGYLQELSKRNYAERLKYHRADYDSDETFGNFRNISVGNIRPGKLFRFCTPKENGAERKETVLKLLEKYQISETIDLTSGDTNIGFDFTHHDFHQHLKTVLLKVAESRGPLGIYCVFGKDRTGAVLMILEGLMGATFREIREDYMLSYKNLYGMKENSEEWQYVVSDIFMKKSREFFGISEEPENIDISVSNETKNFLETKVYMTPEEVERVEKSLRQI